MLMLVTRVFFTLYGLANAFWILASYLFLSFLPVNDYIILLYSKAGFESLILNFLEQN